MANARSSNEPTRLSHQKAFGTTTSFLFFGSPPLHDEARKENDIAHPANNLPGVPFNAQEAVVEEHHVEMHVHAGIKTAGPEQ
jgi:hypothetical protein